MGFFNLFKSCVRPSCVRPSCVRHCLVLPRAQDSRIMLRMFCDKVGVRISSEPKGPIPASAFTPQEVEKMIKRNLTEDAAQPFNKEEEVILRKVVTFSGAYCLCHSNLTYVLRGIRSKTKLLREEEAVLQIIRNIIVPEALPRPEDEEVFTKSGGDFRKLVRDETRRSFAHEMFRELLGVGYERVHQLSLSEVTSLLKNPSSFEFEDWQESECGLGLSACLVEADVHMKFKDCKNLVERHVLRRGFLRVSPWTEDIGILMLKAAGLKLITLVNRRFPFISDWGYQLWECSGKNIDCPSNVVHSYAAICTSTILLDMERECGPDSYAFDGLKRGLMGLMAKLLGAMRVPGSEDNEYLLECVLVILEVGDFHLRTHRRFLTYFLQILDIENPDFCTHAFSAVALLIRGIVTLSDHYEPVIEDMVNEVIRASKKLLSSPSTQERGFHLLEQLFASVDFSAVQPYMKDVWTSLFSLAATGEVKFTQPLVTVMSTFLLKHGADNLVDTVNSVYPNIFSDILTEVWIPALQRTTGPEEFKATVVVVTKLICGTQFFLADPAAQKLWGQLLEIILIPLSQRAKEEMYTNEEYFLCESLALASSEFPGRYRVMMEENLTEDKKMFLLKLCNRNKFTIV